jgi:hypothetical protein
MDSFDNIIALDDISSIEYFITPLAPYFICNHYVSTEINPHDHKYVGLNLNLNTANDLLKNKNYDDIKNFDVIQIQVDYFDFFIDTILPIIIKRDIHVIIITSQWHLPQINKNEKTDGLLDNKNIVLWISQNPIYANSEKYMAMPYGLFHSNLNDYINFVKQTRDSSTKINKILNQYAEAYPHLPDNHIRKIYDIFGKNSGCRMDRVDFLRNILNYNFVISTSGDRDDCYRHYECIGLNSIPISDINRDKYSEIFGEDMIYSNGEDMINMIKNNNVHHNYKKPNRDILLISYWKNKIDEKIKKYNA